MADMFDVINGTSQANGYDMITQSTATYTSPAAGLVVTGLSGDVNAVVADVASNLGTGMNTDATFVTEDV